MTAVGFFEIDHHVESIHEDVFFQDREDLVGRNFDLGHITLYWRWARFGKLRELETRKQGVKELREPGRQAGLQESGVDTTPVAGFSPGGDRAERRLRVGRRLGEWS